MKKPIVIISWIFLIPTLASAQERYHPPAGLGYGFVGAGGDAYSPAGGFGGELFVASRFAMGFELGASGLATTDRYGNSTLTGVGSADLSYHFFSKKSRDREVPFVGGGYTGFFGHGQGSGGLSPFRNLLHGYNIGGGIDLFPTKHFGVRFDIRYYGRSGRIVRNLEPDVTQAGFAAFRICFTFR